MTNNHYVFSVEGNIGSGKSTFLKMLKKHMPSELNKLPVVFLQEPVDKWMSIKDENDETILSKFYKDTNKYAFSFQMMAYVSRLSILRETINNYPNGAIIISERCLETDKKVFAKMLFDDKQIENVNYQIYNMWFNEFNIPSAGHIYIRSNPNTAHERVQKRSRDGEDTIAIEYLTKCHDYHENMMTSIPFQNKLILITEDMEFKYEYYSVWINKVILFVNEKTTKYPEMKRYLSSEDIKMLSYS